MISSFWNVILEALPVAFIGTILTVGCIWFAVKKGWL